MPILRDIAKDLRDRRLWPIAAVLVAALIGIPAFLSTTAASTPAPSIPPSQGLASTGPALPVLSVNNAPAHAKLTSRARDPFKQQAPPASAKTITTPSGGGSPASPAGSGSGSSGSSSTGASTTTTPSRTTTTTTTTTTPAPAPGLTARESYDVSLSITNPSGGVDAIPALERLSILPNRDDPLLVELGVLKGGKRVLFAVQPGASPRGSGQCLPGRTDCELVAIAPNRTETVTSEGNTSAFQFAVTAITAQRHGSAVAATRLRRRESAAGRRLLSDDTSLSALSLFKYVPSLGAILDLRNLSVGGN
jgi:hypothetical protein